MLVTRRASLTLHIYSCGTNY